MRFGNKGNGWDEEKGNKNPPSVNRPSRRTSTPPLKTQTVYHVDGNHGSQASEIGLRMVILDECDGEVPSWAFVSWTKVEFVLLVEKARREAEQANQLRFYRHACSWRIQYDAIARFC